MWCIQHNSPVNLHHLEERLRAYGFYAEAQALDAGTLKNALTDKINGLDVQLARDDISKFVKVPSRLDGWSREMFMAALDEMRFV